VERRQNSFWEGFVDDNIYRKTDQTVVKHEISYRKVRTIRYITKLFQQNFICRYGSVICNVDFIERIQWYIFRQPNNIFQIFFAFIVDHSDQYESKFGLRKISLQVFN